MYVVCCKNLNQVFLHVLLQCEKCEVCAQEIYHVYQLFYNLKFVCCVHENEVKRKEKSNIQTN